MEEINYEINYEGDNVISEMNRVSPTATDQDIQELARWLQIRLLRMVKWCDDQNPNNFRLARLCKVEVSPDYDILEELEWNTDLVVIKQSKQKAILCQANLKYGA